MNNIASTKVLTKEKFSPHLKLEKVRILKKNLLFVIGLPRSLININLLKSKAFFGQYGEIESIYLKKDLFQNGENQEVESLSAYVTYKSEVSTAFAILAIDRLKFNKNVIKASFGRTRYCCYFLKNQKCRNKKCNFVHELVDKKFCFDKNSEENLRIKRINIIESLLNTNYDWQYLKEQYTIEYDYMIFPPLTRAILKIENHIKQLEAKKRKGVENTKEMEFDVTTQASIDLNLDKQNSDKSNEGNQRFPLIKKSSYQDKEFDTKSFKHRLSQFHHKIPVQDERKGSLKLTDFLFNQQSWNSPQSNLTFTDKDQVIPKSQIQKVSHRQFFVQNELLIYDKNIFQIQQEQSPERLFDDFSDDSELDENVDNLDQIFTKDHRIGLNQFQITLFQYSLKNILFILFFIYLIY